MLNFVAPALTALLPPRTMEMLMKGAGSDRTMASPVRMAMSLVLAALSQERYVETPKAFSSRF